MTKKPKVPDKADDKEQSERFIDAARTHETDDSADAFERVFKSIQQPRRKGDKVPTR